MHILLQQIFTQLLTDLRFSFNIDVPYFNSWYENKEIFKRLHMKVINLFIKVSSKLLMYGYIEGSTRTYAQERNIGSVWYSDQEWSPRCLLHEQL